MWTLTLNTTQSICHDHTVWTALNPPPNPPPKNTKILIAILTPGRSSCATRMHSSRMRTAHSLTVWHSCSVCLGGGMHVMHASCHACPQAMHTPSPSATHAHWSCMPPSHACPHHAWSPPCMPPPCMPPSMHTPCHACPHPAMHAPNHAGPAAIHAPRRCMLPPQHMPPSHACPPSHCPPPPDHACPLPWRQNHRCLWKYSLTLPHLRVVIIPSKELWS